MDMDIAHLTDRRCSLQELPRGNSPLSVFQQTIQGIIPALDCQVIGCTLDVREECHLPLLPDHGLSQHTQRH